MLRVGITGVIGSGKTTISLSFASLGVPVYNCDAEAKRLMTENRSLLNSLKSLIGDDISLPDGSLNRKVMASRIFSDRLLLNQVNHLVHPVVADDFSAWADKHEAGGAKWVLCEAAVLAESGLMSRLDKVIVVSIPSETRILRAMARDNVSREEVLSRMGNQRDDEELRHIANKIISPDDRHFVLPQIISIDKEFSNL